jgi:hypothetical protein
MKTIKIKKDDKFLAIVEMIFLIIMIILSIIIIINW